MSDIAQVYAEQRAQQYMGMPQSHVPAGAKAYRDNMFSRYGACAEMALHAYASYAHVIDGYPFKDSLYHPPGDEAAIIRQLATATSGP